MKRRSLKFRLILWYAGWLTILFSVFGVSMYTSLSYYLEQSLRDALARRTRLVANLVERSALARETPGEEIRRYFAPEANSRFTRVTLDGKAIYVSGRPADHSFDPQAVPPAPQKVERELFGKRLLRDGNALYIAVKPRVVGKQKYLIEEGASDDFIKAALRSWVVALVVGLFSLIALAVLGGYVIVPRALKPVDRMIQTAERISSRNLAERLPVANTGDELERLSITLNNMIRRLHESFEHTQRFLADASHELRTPLTMLQAEIEEIGKKINGQPDARERAESAREEVERLKNIVEGLFALTRLDAGEALNESETFDLGQLANSTTDQMSLLAEDKNIVMECDSCDAVTVQGDRARIKQVIVNLVGNALKYTPDGGRISVGVSASGGKAVLEVIDNGIGIPPAALPHIFERFYRVDKARSRDMGGAGLGLSIVKSICAAHSGEVRAESAEGKGTRLVVELPLANETLQAAA